MASLPAGAEAMAPALQGSNGRRLSMLRIQKLLALDCIRIQIVLYLKSIMDMRYALI
jgi:hypothetical protein